ncbi:MAG: DUF5606 domain-containing protein [Bacteroidales bacterium]|nr:DUF5606 domain-containing protein [Bacteroidales bacterium]
MLSKILSVTGRPGLYKLVSTNKNMNIVESLSDGKRIPVYVHEKVIALSDISIYTESGDTPLREVFKAIKEKEGGNQVSLGSKPSGEQLFAYLSEVLPDYNRESVYASDVKKMVAWYNLLTEHQIDIEEELSDEEGANLEEEGTTSEEEGTNLEEEGTTASDNEITAIEEISNQETGTDKGKEEGA